MGLAERRILRFASCQVWKIALCLPFSPLDKRKDPYSSSPPPSTIFPTIATRSRFFHLFLAGKLASLDKHQQALPFQRVLPSTSTSTST